MKVSLTKSIHLAVVVLGCFGAQDAAAISINVGDPGTFGDPASWRTDEFKRDWGLGAIAAEYAYAAGFSGDGIKVGMVDSGFYNQHSQLPSSRYNPVVVDGVSGAYNRLFNDSHGTHVGGTLGAARDGLAGANNFHGVAFNADIFVGNTAKTDGALFGGTFPANATVAQIPDWNYVSNVYKTVNDQGVRIITSSWGSQPSTESYATLASTTSAWQSLSAPSTWFQGALDAAETGTVVVFSAGNAGSPNASPRAGATYFRPELEGNWLAVSGIRQAGQGVGADGAVTIPGTQLYNQCGAAKWACVTAPANGIWSSLVTTTGPIAETYGNLSGTSMAAPHASGALAVIMERFGYMSNEQALNVMLTTSRQDATVNDSSGLAVANPTAGARVVVPDSRNGWGTVDLRAAMNGPGQLTDRFAINTQGQNDTWSNNISDTAIKARRVEDQAEAAAWTATKAARGWQNGLPPGATADDITDYQVGMARQVARDGRVYEGSLSKSGPGSLVLTGDNSFSGGVEVLGGTLVGGSATAFGTGDVIVGVATLAIRSDNPVMISGSLTLTSGSTLDLVLGFGAGYLLDVAGLATFGGQLSLSLADSFLFSGFGLYDLVSYGSYTGVFSNWMLSGLMSGYAADLLYTSAGLRLQLTPVPEPATWSVLIVGSALSGWAARRRNRAGVRR